MGKKDNSNNSEDRLRQVSYSQLPDRPLVPVTVTMAQDQADLKVKYITTAVIYYCNIALGVSGTFVAPALIDFRNVFNTDMQTISVVFTICLVTVLVSVTGFGALFNVVNRHAVITLLFFVMSIAIILLPYSPSLLVFFLLNGLMAICGSGYVTAQVVWVIEIWKEEAGPYIQAQHFFYAVGCMIPPPIFAPFLSNSGGSGSDSDSDSARSFSINNSTEFISTDPEAVSPLHNSTTTALFNIEPLSNAVTASNLIVPCAICGIIVGIGAILLLVILCAFKNKPAAVTVTDGHHDITKVDDNKKDDNIEDSEATKVKAEVPSSTPPTISAQQKIILMILSAALLGAFQAMELNTGHFLPSFAHFSKLHFSESVGANVLSAFALSFTAGRLAGILIILKVAPQHILCGNFIFVIIANLILLIWGMEIEKFMWIGSVLLGIGYSTSVPSIYAYIQKHLEITNFVGAILLVSGVCISAVFPIISGRLIEKMPAILIYLNVFSGVIGAVAFVCILLATKKNKGKNCG